MIPRMIGALLALLLFGGYTTVVVPTALNPLAQIAWNAQGTYAASTLPKVCVNGHTNTATAAQTVSLLKTGTTALGASCARIDYNWDVLETVANRYDWTLGSPSFASYFGTICAAGIQPIFNATYNNPLYASGVFVAVTAGINANAWGAFGAAQATESQFLSCPSPSVDAFNEANLVIWTTVQWSGSAYAPVLATFLSAVKTALPGMKVISSGPSPGPGTVPTTWIAQVAGAGASLSSLDYWGYHPYAYNTSTPSLTPTPDQLLLDLKAFWLYAASGGVSKPLAITEYGFPWDAFSATVTQAALNQQGVYMGWALLNCIVANVTLGSPGVPIFAPYDLVDDGTSYTATDQNSFGLFFNGSATNGNPIAGATAFGIKPAGIAVAEVQAAMSGSISANIPYVITYDMPTSAPTIAFQNTLGTTFAIWTQNGSGSKSWSKQIGNFSSVSCKDLIGNTVSCPYSSGNLSLTLSTSTGPVIATALN